MTVQTKKKKCLKTRYVEITSLFNIVAGVSLQWKRLLAESRCASAF